MRALPRDQRLRAAPRLQLVRGVRQAVAEGRQQLELVKRQTTREQTLMSRVLMLFYGLSVDL